MRSPVRPIVTSSVLTVNGRSPAVAIEDWAPAGPERASSDWKSQPYRKDIDGLRALAVLSVVGFHAAARWIPGGFVGVDIFFVISGFLISTIIFRELDRARFSFATFYARRIRRIFPALIIVLAAVLVIGRFILMAHGYRQLGQDVVAGAGFVSNILLWRQLGYFDGDASLKPLLHLWSLGIEEQYYLLWPLAVFLIWKLKFNRLKLVLWVLALSFIANIVTVQFAPDSAFYLPHTRFWELMVGSALAYVLLYKKDEFNAELARILRISSRRPHLAEIKACSGLAMIVATWFQQAIVPGWGTLLPTFGTFLLISAEEAWINRKLLSNGLLVFVGLISYPLYLWHWPLLSFIRIALGDPPAWATLGAVMLAFLLAVITYKFVEKPVRRNRSVATQRAAVPLLVSTMVSVLAWGALSMRSHGLSAHIPEALQLIAQYEADEHVPPWRKDKCFLAIDRDWRKFDPTCTDTEPAGAPLVFLWGDSHAADLYPGLRQLQSRYKFRLAEYAAAECPPLLKFQFDARRKFCPEINSWVSRKIVALKPDIVVLAGQRWNENLPGVREGFSSAVALMEESGIKNIIVVGPNPRWQNPLPMSLVWYDRAGTLRTIPDRMNYNLDPSVFAADQQLRKWVSETEAIYLSPLDVLCNPAGCLTKVREDETTDLTAFDYHHLTEAASRHLADQIFAPLLARIFAGQENSATKK